MESRMMKVGEMAGRYARKTFEMMNHGLPEWRWHASACLLAARRADELDLKRVDAVLFQAGFLRGLGL